MKAESWLPVKDIVGDKSRLHSLRPEAAHRSTLSAQQLSFSPSSLWSHQSPDGVDRSLGLRFLEEHDVGVGVSSEDTESLAVWRILQIDNLLGIEVGDLPPR